ncbi:related to positive activator of transcription [Lecanosticta acicola]|uniref:Related to positive activator of transcription n=1 Tax=Lecanosticta acicola TaxID=111012 RepID=A0AAI8YT01_9PEZI|nr:related to positive activator of transcription [Lecanosticta acicola]
MPTKRSIACSTCHKRKIKCSFTGPPCSACAESSSECRFPTKDKNIKVRKRYHEHLIEENKRLSALVSTINTPAQSPAEGTTNDDNPQPRADNADRNPMVEERPWFMAHKASDLPIHIGEAADAAFATRLRQAASGRSVNHMPRVQYLGDDAMRSLADSSSLELPSASRLRYLIDVAMNTVCKTWHIVRRSVVNDSVDKVLSDPSSCDWLSACRIWALLALGEAYSSRCTLPDTPFPGSKYFARAMAMVAIPSERPRLATIEIYLLLSIYSSVVNRRHTATFMASYALRIAVIIGLHIEISESQLKDRMLREHRCRLWWTVYCFDRMWASKIGWPPSIQDKSIEIDLPSDQGLPPDARADLHDAEHMIFVVRLARLTNSTVSSLYVRKRQQTSFSERVQVAVRSLTDWAADLPPRLQLDMTEGAPNPRHVTYMHLSFNQSVIVTTRPILLHILRQRRLGHSNNSFPESAASLTTACIRCARQSLELLKRAWTDGTVATFDYFNTQYIFSAATILALSVFLRGNDWSKDYEDFQMAVQFLQQLDRSGNFAAKEYSMHIDAIRTTLEEHMSGDTLSGSGPDQQIPGMPSIPQAMPIDPVSPGPPLQDFLNLPAIDLDFMETGGTWLDWQDLSWPLEMQQSSGYS